jgi:hypothetical protein
MQMIIGRGRSCSLFWPMGGVGWRGGSPAPRDRVSGRKGAVGRVGLLSYCYVLWNRRVSIIVRLNFMSCVPKLEIWDRHFFRFGRMLPSY